MTELARKNTTKKILDAYNNLQNKEDYLNAISDIDTAMSDDDLNRKEFLNLNFILQDFYTELKNSYGINYSSNYFQISNVTYFSNIDYTATKQDSLDLWNGVKLTKDNIFYVPLVVNSEKLILDVINEEDTDGTTNIEPIVPSNYTTLSSSATNDAYNEKTTMTLITWAVDSYTNGYSSAVNIEITLPISNYISKIYYYSAQDTIDPNYFTINNYIHFYDSNNIVFSIGKVENKGYDYNNQTGNYDFYIETSFKTELNKPTSGNFTIKEKITSSSTISKNIILHLVSYWKQIIQEQLDAINNLIEPTSNDSSQKTILQNIITIINNWLILNDTDKYLSQNLSIVTSTFIQRNIDIDSRKTYLLELNISSTYEELDKTIILRLKKRNGTLNALYRKTISLNSIIDRRTTDTNTLNYYNNKFVVKEVIDGAQDSKIIYTYDFTDFIINDTVYIISDNIQLKEAKTIIKDVVDYKKPKKNSVSLQQEYTVVKKITLANSITSLFISNDNARIVKQLIP